MLLATHADINDISIHALRVEGDAWEFYNHPDVADFYPRPPGGGRPLFYNRDHVSATISIHALRVEGDMDYPPPR